MDHRVSDYCRLTQSRDTRRPRARSPREQWGVVSIARTARVRVRRRRGRAGASRWLTSTPFTARVYAVGHAEPTVEGCGSAAVKACGDGAVLGYYAAGRALPAPEVGRPAARGDRRPGTRAPKGVKTHRTRHLPRHRHHPPPGHPGDHARADPPRPRSSSRTTSSAGPCARPRPCASRPSPARRLARAPGPQRGRANLARSSPPAPLRPAASSRTSCSTSSSRRASIRRTSTSR